MTRTMTFASGPRPAIAVDWNQRTKEVAMLPIIWVTCAAVIVTAAIRTRHHDASARRLGRWGVGVLYVAAGAAVNGFFLLRGDDYATFADGAYLSFVRDTWHDVVVPHHEAWIGLLIAFELAVGVLAVLGGRRTQLAYAAAIAFHVALPSFGWGFFLWSVPMVAALVTLLRAERGAERRLGSVASAGRGDVTGLEEAEGTLADVGELVGHDRVEAGFVEGELHEPAL
jgi:hypothetical protein